ncbi:MAG: 23S rRNA (uracil(1939)-C(5))-methyltransferase RlmD [Gammaproteobacteria bacterium]|jgi:23S rRNA (uracil1939-C5)-methyltransferase|nr:23S rRNA (uracil(1939)-C(5))-methyltransferase RlmD [Gammaproteobacteria bacterium]MDP6615849.1 23S rRNA (uracil(1939)-C(5))-methyltransferase RlmD [Gammaproteobacteria bacterium]MDP6694333.1 23S rRNA (uracil(1939)-C(5))-methyltransferase RlmD [Gammaproteobacteria bacterium]MDP7041765.1 23S rRNA (uracil(1939)-C(5))-methyltransferase RlmD [Gammaproteobacteria bacterium]
MGKWIDNPEETATVRDAMMDGRGVVDVPGKIVFVDASISGEVVRFRRQRRRKNYDEAELLEVIEASPDRVEPACANFGVCGGCSLQHLGPTAQLKAKQATLLDSFRRIAGVQPEHVLQPLAGRPLGYRRRARLGAKLVDKKGRVLVGFREQRKPYVADMQSCETLVPELAAMIPGLSAFIGSLDICRQIPQIELSHGDNAFALVFRVLEEPGSADLARFEKFQDQVGAHVWLQSGGPDTLQPLNTTGSHQDLWYELPDYGLRLTFGPLDFIQVNQDMNRRMIRQALALLELTGTEHVLDLFCGIGNFTLPLALNSMQVTGVELDTQMVCKAEANARANNLTNTSFHAADLSREEQPDWWREDFDIVVLDPPRIGARDVLPAVARTGAAKLLYISCHPGSMARDAGILISEHGFSLKAAGAMDMFPQTSHVEAMALFER